MTIPVITDEQIEITAALAKKIWNQHYVAIIGQDQVDYMVDKFQSEAAFAKQIDEGYLYFLIQHEENFCGYLALVVDEAAEKLMISKIYVDADFRGLGLGKQLMDFAIERGKEKHLKTLWLTVNKYNTNSIEWYKHLGFNVKEAIQIDIGNGFIMDDYLMEKPI